MRNDSTWKRLVPTSCHFAHSPHIIVISMPEILLWTPVSPRGVKTSQAVEQVCPSSCTHIGHSSLSRLIYDLLPVQFHILSPSYLWLTIILGWPFQGRQALLIKQLSAGRSSDFPFQLGLGQGEREKIASLIFLPYNSTDVASNEFQPFRLFKS